MLTRSAEIGHFFLEAHLKPPGLLQRESMALAILSLVIAEVKEG
jgi:hypothetical protein